MKKIAIVGWKTGDNSFGATIPYLNYFSKFGTVHILTPEQDIDESIDLLVLPGGKDVNPTRYEQIPSFYNTDINPFLESFDTYKLPQYIEKGIPVFGICRGFQSLNVYFGGNLTQHHLHGYSTKSRSEIIHELDLIQANLSCIDLSKMDRNKNNKIIVKANSIHHQVVGIDNLAEPLLPTLMSDKNDNVIEAFIHETFPIAGVQYHPEEIYNEPYSDQIIEALLNKKPL